MKLSNSISPLLVAMRLFGINPIPSPEWCWLKIQLVLLFIIKIFLVSKIWIFYSRKDSDHLRFKTFVHNLKDICDIISAAIDFMLTFLNSKRNTIPLNDFEIIDEALENFGICANNKNTYRLLILQLVSFGVIPVLLSVFHFYTLAIRKDGNEYNAVAFMSGVAIIMITYGYRVIDCSICTNLSIIRERFKVINGIIRRMNNRGAKANIAKRVVSSGVTDDVIFQNLKILRERYHQLWDIANQIDEAYGPHILMAAATTLVMVTVLLWEASPLMKSDMNSADFVFLSAKVSWAIFAVTCLILLTEACESTVSEAKVTSVVLQELMMKGNHNSTTMDEIRDFLMQLELEVHDFSACRFFDINGRMVHSLVGAVSTYLIILIQMTDD